MIHKILIVVPVLTLVWSGLLQSQHPDDWIADRKALSHWLGEMYFDLGIASGHFADNLNQDLGIGLGGELLYQVRNQSPVWAGIGVHSFAFDSESLRYSDEFNGVITNYRDRTTSRAFLAHGVLRFQPDIRSDIRPYLQGAVGVHWFFTNTKIRDTDIGEQVDRINESRDAELGFAIHAGIQIIPRGIQYLHVDARIGYFRNASVEYLRYNPDLPGGGLPIDQFESKNSAVDIFGIHLGISTVITGDPQY